ncbi:hypothetical protein AC1031_005228 [Aphanomyces cochlioides]|nr:hypothetical protein AC1031_005228 [Aphanomyces cochlioides]
MELLAAVFTDDRRRGLYSLRDRESLPEQTTLYDRVHFIVCLCGSLTILYICWRIVRYMATPFDSELKAMAYTPQTTTGPSWTTIVFDWISANLGLHTTGAFGPGYHRRRAKSRASSLLPIPEDAAMVDLEMNDTRQKASHEWSDY